MITQWAGEDPATLSEERVREFFLHLINDRGYAPKSIRQARAGLVGFFRDMLERADWKVFDNVKTKDREALPVVLTRAEVKRILAEVKEPRFLVPLIVIYLCGLRLSECLHIEISDIHRAEKRLHIRQGKGCKDRYVPLPDGALGELERWYVFHRHPRYLFPAMGPAWRATERRDAAAEILAQRMQLHRAECPMSTSGLQRVFRLALAASGVKKPATIHSLRHSYATHLLEEGVNIRYVSAYLGHASLEQTLIYLHLTEASEEHSQAAVANMAGALGVHGPAAKAPAPKAKA